jgi:hypothetical protein
MYVTEKDKINKPLQNDEVHPIIRRVVLSESIFLYKRPLL